MKQRRDDEEFDYVIVGSGAAGASAARVLADTGSSIVVLEEGPAVETAEFGDRAFPAFRRLYRDKGAQVARGRTFIPVVQGSCLGGSTVVNSGISWRLPDDVWATWQTEYGLGAALPLAELHRHWDRIESELGVGATPEVVWGENNRLMDVARRARGLAGGPTRRNAPGCRGSARCQLGCAFGAKQSMLVSYLPYARERGAVLRTEARVDRVLWKGDRAVGVVGRDFTYRAARAVIVAASAIQTPGLLSRSGVRSPYLGRHLQGHPGTPLVGIFDHEVNMWSGATQGYEVDEHRERGRFKVETVSLPTEMFLATLPGVGRRWVEAMAQASKAASWAVVLRAYAHGRVREGPFGTTIHFDLERRDMENLRRGLRVTAELLFAAGAREVVTGVRGLPERIGSEDQAALLEGGPLDPAAYLFSMSHLFGTARMSVRPADGVVGTDFAVHGRQGLYVIDSSVFPTNLGVNPQLTIMAVAMHAAEQLAEAA
jgi:choline dehydrogenase-like flavoprotein